VTLNVFDPPASNMTLLKSQAAKAAKMPIS